MPAYPDPARWSRQIHVKIDTDGQHIVADANGGRPVIKFVIMKTHIFDDNLQKQLTLEYEMQKCLNQTE